MRNKHFHKRKLQDGGKGFHINLSFKQWVTIAFLILVAIDLIGYYVLLGMGREVSPYSIPKFLLKLILVDDTSIQPVEILKFYTGWMY